jgi:hypothetical protein
MKRLIAVAALAGLSLVVAGCGGAVTGQPSAAGGASGGGGSAVLPTGSAAPPTSPSSGLTDQPCSLFSSADLQQLNASTPPSSTMSGPFPVCQIDTGFGVVTIGMIKQSLAQAALGSQVMSVTVGTHQAKQFPVQGDSDSCQMAIGISDTLRVDMDVVADNMNGGPKQTGCQFALQVAQIVEPHLPAG